MNLLEKIKDVEKISVFSDGILYKSSKNELFSLKEESVILLDKVYDYEVFNQTIFYQESNLEKLCLLNLYSQKKKFISGIFSLRGAFHINENNIYILGKENSSKVIYIFDTKTFLLKSITTANYFPKLSANNLCFCEKKDAIYCFDTLLNKNLWSYSLPEGFKIFGQVQMIDNLLILYAVDNNFDHSKTIALDINSGNIKWELDNTIFCQIDDEKKRLLGYAIRKYEVIDPFSGKIIVQKSMMDYYEKGLSPVSPSNTIANGKLWFVSGRGENAKFGRINIETSQVDFIQDFPLQNNGQLSKPVFHNGKLYLLDSNNTLHIFEE
uniref:hypothetical protein n=1 Tax=Ornithobacterium rhinotracheale TaxID=28251 RepID=UPI0039A43753